MRATICPNEFPSRTGTRRIAIVAEAPGSHEMAWTTCSSCKHQFASEYTDQRGTRQSWTRCASCGCVDIVSTPRPLVGPSGRLLNKLLDEAGIRREECFVGNVTNRQPPRNEISRFKWDGPEIQEGLEALRRDLTQYQPHFILALGGTALKALGRGSIDDRRGYLFMSTGVVEGVKTLATFHPARLLRESGLTGIVRHDMGKAAVACRSVNIDVPERIIHYRFSRQTIVDLLAGIREKRTRVAIDIEGGVNGIACIGFATSPVYALVIPFTTADGESVWSEEDEITLMEAVRDILEDPLVPKIIQNALYELFVLAWATGIVIRGVTDDTMVKHFELYPEWEKSLEFQASIYVPTQPWWKLTHRNVKGRYVPYRDGKPVTSQEWYIYNGTDCCVTYACDQAQERQLQPRQREHYRFNMELLTPLLYMMLKGIRYDYENAKTHRQAVQKKIYALQDRINREAVTQGQRPELACFLASVAALSGLRGGQSCNAQLSGVEAEGRLQETASSNPRRIIGAALPDETSAGGPGSGSGQGGKEGTLSLPCGSRDVPLVELQRNIPDIGDNDEIQDRINREAATGGKRPELASFLEATATLQSPSGDGTGSTGLLQILTTAFCVARRVEKREVEETRWQPYRWNGKTRKWVKDGKRLNSLDHTSGWEWVSENSPNVDPAPDLKWLKPVVKVVTRNVPVEITSLKDVRRFARGAVKAQCRRSCAILTLSHRHGYLLPHQRGELATLLGLSVKIRASGRDRDEEDEETGDIVRGDERDANWFLYDHCALPKQYVKEGNRLTDRLASDAEAVIKAWLASSRTEKGRDRRALWFAALKSLLTEARNLTAMPDDDGRIRSSYNLVGSKTHRLSNSGSPTRTSRLNLQTITKSHRRFYLADPDHEMCQRDLSGADGWTVAAYCAMLGDPNMLEDYRASLKPAQIITLMLKDGSAVNRLSRDDLKPLCKPITEETHWQYFAMKRGQHGWSYRMGDKTTSDQILTDSIKKSGKPIYVAPKECARLRDTCFFVRYPGIPKMHDYFRRQLIETGSITASNGFTRRFYGRKDEDDTLREAIAHLPQVYTTYATCLALHRLWTDPTNCRGDGSLIIEPLHTVHDSLVTQWPREVTEWARDRMKAWFDNPIDIARTRLVIPASGTFGPSWGEQTGHL